MLNVTKFGKEIVGKCQIFICNNFHNLFQGLHLHIIPRPLACDYFPLEPLSSKNTNIKSRSRDSLRPRRVMKAISRRCFQATVSSAREWIEPSIMPLACNAANCSGVLKRDKIKPVCWPSCGGACRYSTGVSDSLIGEAITWK